MLSARQIAKNLNISYNSVWGFITRLNITPLKKIKRVYYFDKDVQEIIKDKVKNGQRRYYAKESVSTYTPLKSEL